ncbi:WhiB family transcriptional regulator, partial [Glutamicibacter sp. V16R2B1]|uniref:WhiB family transcriptional regulator n=1 Tax=Glutamicibacter sp. V16R2B1 TaxID=2036207 RepID=UPI0010FE81FC
MASLPCSAPAVARPVVVDLPVGSNAARSPSEDLARLRADIRQVLAGQAWRLDAACRGHAKPDIFFTPGLTRHTTDTERARILTDGREAAEVCAVCPVTRHCVMYAVVAGEDHGVWGGTTARQIRSARKRLVARLEHLT